MCANTYVGSAFRATKIGTDPAESLSYLIEKYVLASQRVGHKAEEVVKKLVKIAYYPTKREKVQEGYKPILKYTYSDTRPTKTQLIPITKLDFKLMPEITLAPLKAKLNYAIPNRKTNAK